MQPCNHAFIYINAPDGRGGGRIASDDGTLNLRFFEDVRTLFNRLDSPAALGRACEAAVRAPLPSLGDVRKLLQVSKL